MPRKNAKHQAWLHSQLMSGLTNQASSGKMVRPSSKSSKELEEFMKRAARNQTRNKRNAARKAQQRENAWRRAEQAAREELRKEGDTSDPLPRFVREFLPQDGSSEVKR